MTGVSGHFALRRVLVRHDRWMRRHARRGKLVTLTRRLHPQHAVIRFSDWRVHRKRRLVGGWWLVRVMG